MEVHICPPCSAVGVFQYSVLSAVRSAVASQHSSLPCEVSRLEAIGGRSRVFHAPSHVLVVFSGCTCTIHVRAHTSTPSGAWFGLLVTPCCSVAPALCTHAAPECNKKLMVPRHYRSAPQSALKLHNKRPPECNESTQQVALSRCVHVHVRKQVVPKRPLALAPEFNNKLPPRVQINLQTKWPPRVQ